MNQSQKTGKKIVSKGKRMGLILLAKCYVVIGFLCIIAILAVPSFFLLQNPTGEVSVLLLMLTLPPVLGGLGAALFFKQAAKIDTDLPSTRANSADLPAHESLVRASEEPMQAQEAVLLRAATEGQETHEKQLLRPEE